MLTALFLTGAILQSGVKPVDLNPLIEKVDFEGTSIESGLATLFRQAKAPFKSAPEVKGKVTISLRNHRLNTVLRNVLYQVDGLFEVRDGVYVVFSKNGTPSRQTVDLFEFHNMDADLAIKRLFDQVQLPYRWKDKPTGTVSVPFPPSLSFESALRAVLDVMKYDYQVVRGVYLLQRGQVATKLPS